MSDPRRPDVVTAVVTRVDGNVTILRVVVREYRPPTAEEIKSGAAPSKRVVVREINPTPEYVNAIIAKHNWQGPQAPVSWRFVPNDYVPEDMPKSGRVFRDAWKDDGTNKPGVDMPKAREIHRRRLRKLRAPLLEALDTDYMRADEAGDNQRKKEIAARKQALRDVTADPAIEAAQTPEELLKVGMP